MLTVEDEVGGVGAVEFDNEASAAADHVRTRREIIRRKRDYQEVVGPRVDYGTAGAHGIARGAGRRADYYSVGTESFGGDGVYVDDEVEDFCGARCRNDRLV